MKDSNGVGEGPYLVIKEVDDELGVKWFLVNGPGITEPKMTATSNRDEAIVSASIRNRSYSEGRKAERERCAKIAEGFALPLDGPWDSLRGKQIEFAIRGVQDGE